LYGGYLQPQHQQVDGEDGKEVEKEPEKVLAKN
jgi:hypothetical protein